MLHSTHAVVYCHRATLSGLLHVRVSGTASLLRLTVMARSLHATLRCPMLPSSRHAAPRHTAPC